MLAPSMLPELLAQSKLDRHARSALPGAPVLPHQERRLRVRRRPRR